MSQSISPLRDRELLEILAEEPELLAIADALVETRQAQPAPRRRRLRPVLVRGWEPRLALVAAALALSGLIVSLAIAGTGWLTGEPAPAPVVTDFQAYTPQLGFHPDPGSAVLVADDGQAKLYATTNREGTYCLDLVTPWKPATTLDGGTCVPRAIASGHFVAGIVGAGPLEAQGMTVIVTGRIADPQARSVRFTGSEGQTVTRPVGTSGFFMGALTTAGPCARGDWRSTFTALDGDGNAVAQTSQILLEELTDKDSPMRGQPGWGCVFKFLQK